MKKTNPKSHHSPSSLTIPDDAFPERADRSIAGLLFGAMSRSKLSTMIRQGQVLVDGQRIRPSTVVKAGQVVTIEPAEESFTIASPCREMPDPDILFEDDDLIVLDKPAGLTVHPGAGTKTPTLMDLLVKSRQEMIGIGDPNRWGIVHRLDKDTTGVMVVAKSQIAYQELSLQFRNHSVGRIYMALVRGNPKSESGCIEKELGRSQTDRKKMSTVTRKGRSAVTDWSISKRYGPVSLLEVRPQTGRTHQIRAHLASIGLPILGDRVYGASGRSHKQKDPIISQAELIIRRQALHASFLAIIHPVSGQELEFSSDLPVDMQSIIKVACQGIS